MREFSCRDLYDRNRLTSFLGEFGIRPNKNLGQHFLTDERVLRRIAQASGAGRLAIEVGAGVGSLTCFLKRKFEKVYAVELGEEFKEPFEAINPEENVEFRPGNILDLNFSGLADRRLREENGIVGNIPYNITGKILQRALAYREYFSRAVFTLQKEVADRVLAEPGNRGCGRLSYQVRAYGEVDHLLDVPPEKFYPPPDVESAVIVIDLQEEGEFDVHEELLSSLLRGVFIHRRKTIRNALINSPEFSLDREGVDSLLGQAVVEPGWRPAELSLEDYGRLAKSLEESRGY